MPYVGDESTFYIVLPNNVEGINELLEKLKDFSVLEKTLYNLYATKVEAYIPKFKIETTTNLKEILPEVSIQN